MSDTPIYIGTSLDLRHLYDSDEPGRDFVVAKETYFNEYAIQHIINDHPERVDWISTNVELICKAIQEPAIVYRRLAFKNQMGHWTQAYTIRDPNNEERCVTVVLSLARLGGEESDAHQVVTAYNSKLRDFYRNTPAGLETRDRWLKVIQPSQSPQVLEVTPILEVDKTKELESF